MKPSIVFRAVLYMTLAAFPPWIAHFSGIVDQLLDGKEPLYHWAVWALTISTSMYQSILALRIYIDGSAERSKQQTAESNQP